MTTNCAKLLLVGNLPLLLPVGQSVSFQMLVDGLGKRGIPHDLIDLSSSDMSRRDGAFSWHRAFELVRTFPRYARYLIGSRRTAYLLIGRSRVSFLRDCYFIWLASLLGHRIVTHLKGGNFDCFYADQPQWLQWFIKKTLERVDKIIVLSTSLESCFDFLGSSGRDKITVVPNGLPFELQQSVTPVSLQPGEPIRLLYLSNMIESKGYWKVLEACRILIKQRIPFRCEFCGEFRPASDDQLYHSAAEARQAFLRAIEEWQLEKEVEWWGIVRGKEKILQLQRAHCFVLPTRYNNEGQPVSIIEALAFGKVIIATQYRAIPDMVSGGYNGFFVDSDSPEQIAQRVEWLWRNPGEVTRMSLNSLARYRQNFTREKHLSKLLSVLCDSSSPRSDDRGSGETHLPERR